MNIIDNSIGENEIINLIQVDCLEFPDFRLFYRMTVILQPYQKKKKKTTQSKAVYYIRLG